MTSRWEPEGFATLDAWRDYRRTLDRRPPTLPDPDEDPTLGRADCLLCEGAGWVEQYDEFLHGWVEGRCPACQDLTVKARKGRWETNDGERVGPK